MGIKGIYGEIGPGERVALSKLAVEKFEQTDRPLRIAVDISIWQFQIQSGRGGTNPALRTLYFRLLRLLSLSIQPLFVFDGSQKPPFKRNKKTVQGAASLPNFLTKHMLKLFGFPFHVAPGEAEAECALLQQKGLVDAVLSEDVDTLMFGCGTTFRNWSAEGSRGNHAPTHVSVYDAKATKAGKSRLDREGMILIALMSGGDYITEGVPGCGIKVACEAARAGFGSSLCKLANSDVAGLSAWRLKLSHELQTNESSFFRVKHKALRIPDDFPNREVLGYYTHPVVSSQSKLQSLKNDILWGEKVDITGLRQFVAEAFEWTNKGGAIKFIRGLAPALLVSKLCAQVDRRASGYGDLLLTAINEMELVRAVHSQRTHFSSDGIPELRLIYCPLDIVPIDIDAETDGSEDIARDSLATMDDDGNADANESGDCGPPSTQIGQKGGASIYDPREPGKVWVPETYAKIGIPLKVQDYEESLRNPRKLIKQKAITKKAAMKGGMQRGALDKYVTVTKAGAAAASEPRKCATRTGTIIEDRNMAATPASPYKPAAGLPSTITTRSTKTKTAKKLQNAKLPQTKTQPSNPWVMSLSSSSTNNQVASVTKITSPQSTKAYVDEGSPESPSSARKHFLPPGMVDFSSPPMEPLDGGEFSSPSPRKKRAASPPNSKHQTLTPKGCEKSANNTSGDEKQLTSHKVNRKLDFWTIDSSPAQPHSPDSDLPDLEELVSPRREAETSKLSSFPDSQSQRTVIDLSSSPLTPTHAGKSREVVEMEAPSPIPEHRIRNRGGRKRFIVLRDSLEGGWRETDIEPEPVEEKRGGKRDIRSWRLSQVEMIDMTGD